MRRLVLLIFSASLLAGAATAIAAAAFPARIDLPNGYRPEGIATGKGKTLYVGSIPTGEVRRVDARTGEVEPLVAPREGRAAIGLKFHRNRLFVAGGPTGKGFVYDARTGEDLAQFQFHPAAPGATFVNDVAIVKKNAYFTDSRRSVLYVLRTDLKGFKELPLPDVPLLEGNNLNGIVGTPSGKALIAVQGNAGNLWRIDPKTGRSVKVAVPADEVVNGDGLLLTGKRTLYVVQNRRNRITVLRLSKDLTSATVRRRITSDDFDVPTTVARLGRRLYLPNARFRTAPEPPPADGRYWITQVRK